MDDFTNKMLGSAKGRGSAAGQLPPGTIKCRQCEGPMDKTSKVEKSLALQLVGVLLFIVGLALLFAFPIGTAAGVILMIGAARLGYRKQKVWKCRQCGYFFERAD